MSVYLKRKNRIVEFIAGAFNQAAGSLGFDSELSTTSRNAVENRIVAGAVNDINADIADIKVELQGKLELVNNQLPVEREVDETTKLGSNINIYTDQGKTGVVLKQVTVGDVISVAEGNYETSVIVSPHAPTSTAVKSYVDPLTAIDGTSIVRDPVSHEMSVVVDDALDATSSHPVANSVVTRALGSLTGALQFMGSVQFNALPSLLIAKVGGVYNITNDAVTTNDFVEGAGVEIPAGTDVVCVEIDDVKYWDILGNSSIYQHKTLSTPITINGTAATTVEGALSALNSYIDSIKSSLSNMCYIAFSVDTLPTNVMAGSYGIVIPSTTNSEANVVNAQVYSYNGSSWVAESGRTLVSRMAYNYVTATTPNNIATFNIHTTA